LSEPPSKRQPHALARPRRLVRYDEALPDVGVPIELLEDREGRHDDLEAVVDHVKHEPELRKLPLSRRVLTEVKSLLPYVCDRGAQLHPSEFLRPRRSRRTVGGDDEALGHEQVARLELVLLKRCDEPPPRALRGLELEAERVELR